MAQRKHLTWADLRVGLFVLVGLFILAVGVIYVTGTTVLGERYTLRTYMENIAGITRGAPVRLDGIDIGNVEDVRFVPDARDPRRNIELRLRVHKDFQPMIRTDSVARLVTEGLLGNRYVSISRGFTGVPVPEGGEVMAVTVAPIETVFDKTVELTDRVNALLAGLQEGKGTLGRLLTDDSLFLALRNTAREANQLLAEVRGGRGSLGKLVASDELYNRLESTVDRVDGLLAGVERGEGTFGKLVKDPTLYDNARLFLERGNGLLGDLQQGRGTLGKLVTDDALYHHLNAAAANVESATSKLNRADNSFGKFFSDPQFYDNVTGLAGDLRLLIGEFRQNPKKFLRIKFSIF
ncbi:MAG: MlaD family protein [Firmicutes bacterium]|nr:MlaD family protein [Bacillota bacterium]